MVISKFDRHCSAHMPGLHQDLNAGMAKTATQFCSERFSDCPGMEDLSLSDDGSEISDAPSLNDELNQTMHLTTNDVLGTAFVPEEFPLSQTEIDKLVEHIISKQACRFQPNLGSAQDSSFHKLPSLLDVCAENGKPPTNSILKEKPVDQGAREKADNQLESLLHAARSGTDTDVIIDIIVLLFGLTVSLSISAVEKMRTIPVQLMVPVKYFIRMFLQN